MSRDVVIGYHGKPRCAWAGAGDTAFGRYHDEVWGTRTDDESAMVEDASIIRNRGKIQATVDNARAMMSASPSLVALAKSYEITRERAPRSVADLPTSTPQAQAFAKQLKSQGYRFVGPTSVYAFMQNVGVVNDHIHGCFRATDYRTASRSR
jgi:DNA-3-methyladenine glycosylase I